MKLILLLLGLFANPNSENVTINPDPIQVEFTLRNNSMKSIPLMIPGVMNPNLSPVSNSGVRLKVGQKILFRYKGKKRTLLVVDESLADAVLDVSKLLKEKKQEIDAEK